MNDNKGEKGNLLSDAKRWTTVGKWIRNLSLDEMLQLFNVVFSDLSLIGPLPLLIEYLNSYNSTQIHKYAIKSSFKVDVRPYIAVSDVHVLLSYREGFLNLMFIWYKYKEALLPFNINGCNDIVVHIKTGILVPIKIVYNLLKATRYLLENSKIRKEFVEKTSHYTPENFKIGAARIATDREYKKWIAQQFYFKSEETRGVSKNYLVL